ncbi:MAG: M48 family peptidase [Puniceicoccaceae bacterium]|nr:MAG: M48 family peptidase [Puniceicoccaceae bacterium]
MKPVSKHRLRPVLLWLVVFLFVAACYTVPETGRRSLSLIPASQEMAMGVSAFDQIKQQERLATDRAKIERVQRIGHRIAEAVGDDLPGAEWEFVLFENEAVNAFALPGGKVGVFTGLLDLAETDDELAVVMGHEVAHVTARHGGERMSQIFALTAVGVALDAALSGQDQQTRALAMAAYGVGTTVGVILPYSRRAESEADEIGLIYMARAGYDPRAAITFWEKMAERAKGASRPPEFLSTHPSDETRIARLQMLMPRALAIYEENRS